MDWYRSSSTVVLYIPKLIHLPILLNNVDNGCCRGYIRQSNNDFLLDAGHIGYEGRIQEFSKGGGGGGGRALLQVLIVCVPTYTCLYIFAYHRPITNHWLTCVPGTILFSDDPHGSLLFQLTVI